MGKLDEVLIALLLGAASGRRGMAQEPWVTGYCAGGARASIPGASIIRPSLS